MPAIRFGILSLIGTVVYATVVASIGYGVGSAWHSVSHDISVAGYVIVALVVVAIGAFILIRLRELRREARAAAAAGDAGERPVSSHSHEA